MDKIDANFRSRASRVIPEVMIYRLTCFLFFFFSQRKNSDVFRSDMGSVRKSEFARGHLFVRRESHDSETNLGKWATEETFATATTAHACNLHLLFFPSFLTPHAVHHPSPPSSRPSPAVPSPSTSRCCHCSSSAVLPNQPKCLPRNYKCTQTHLFSPFQ